MRPILFISDLHLGPQRPEKLELFKQLLRGPALKAEALYILGDLFDQFWVGNDDRTVPNPEIIDTLHECSSAGTGIFFIRGNRELMLDKGFESLTGCRLLADETVIELDGKKVLLMHGDRLCSGDTRYQFYRRFMESPLTKNLFRKLPYTARIRLSHGLRPWMQSSTLKKPEFIVDVDQATVERFMLDHGVSRLIHGHTHRPDRHPFSLEGANAERIVLGDWYEGDSVLVYREGGYRLMRVRELLQASN